MSGTPEMQALADTRRKSIRDGRHSRHRPTPVHLPEIVTAFMPHSEPTSAAKPLSLCSVGLYCGRWSFRGGRQ